MSRRGLPRVIQTDNGTNFVSIDSKLKALYQTLDKQESQQKISSYISSHRIQWKRIPARSPNFGGIWETGVRLAKRLLKKMTNNLTFTYEEFNTILAQVEAVLNSRPIAPLETISEEGLEALTPGHFLVGRALQSLLTDKTSSNRVSSIKRWNLLQKPTEEFWQQWKADYLLHLNRYRKWLSPTPNLKTGDVVLCRDLGEFANHTWLLDRIEEVHPGSDDRVREVTLRVGKKLQKRPTNKDILPVPDLEEQTTSSYPSNEISRDNSHPMDHTTHDSLQSSSTGPRMVQPLD